MKSLISILVILSSLSFSNSIHPVEKLRKIKLRLTSKDVTSAEYSDYLDYINKHCKNNDSYNEQCIKTSLGYFIDRFMNDDGFKKTGLLFTQKIFRFNSSFGSSSNEGVSREPYVNLVNDIFTGNQSWDQLFIGNKYKLSKYINTLENLGINQDFEGGSDAKEFYQNYIVKANIKINNLGEEASREIIDLIVNDENLAGGIITTPKFVGRYHNTLRNKGRKRAAAILRVGMCEDLIPSVDLDEHKKFEEIQVAIGETFIDMDAEKLHGTQRSCKSCHLYKGLDPLAQTFWSIEGGLKKTVSPGALIYTNLKGELKNTAVKGVGDYLRKLVKTDKYKSCQVTNLWKHYVASEETLSKKLKLKLIKKYTEFDGKIKDVLKYMLVHYGYYYRAGENKKKAPVNNKIHQLKQSFKKAKNVLKNCNQCHYLTPVFYEFPLRGTSFDGKIKDEKYYANELYKQLALGKSEIGHGRTMPEEGSDFQPTQQDLREVKNWIDLGMPDSSGERMLK